MYVCLCNAIRDTELETLARQGVRCAEEAYAALGVELSCATCLDHAQELLDHTVSTQSAA